MNTNKEIFNFKWYFKQSFIYILLIFLSIIPFGGIILIPLLAKKEKLILNIIKPYIDIEDAKKVSYEIIETAKNTAEQIRRSKENDLSLLNDRLKDKGAEYQRLVNEAKKNAEQQLADTYKNLHSLKEEKEKLVNQIKTLKELLINLEDEELYQSFALYRPMYDFVNSETYKIKLDDIREQQKNLIKSDMAVTGIKNWTVNGDSRRGQKMVKDTQKLLLRAFNNECDFAINKVNYRNFDASKKRISKAYESISKLGIVMSITVTEEYYNLKIRELHLAFEYQEAKQREKERLLEIRAEERELAKLEKELEAERKKIKKEKMHYANAISAAREQLAMCTDDNKKVDLENKLKELEYEASEIDKSLVNLDYRESNQRAGYVYIISNIGAFGSDIYKIGMTRRLDPMDRINELGDASVPFKFDVHALIFSEDAPALENALHKAFDSKKVNMVNARREFFNVTIEEIMHVVRNNFDGTVEFIKIPEATQYRETLKMRSLI